jgi:hypothetical protein
VKMHRAITAYTLIEFLQFDMIYDVPNSIGCT